MKAPNQAEAVAQIALMRREGWRLIQRKAVSRLPRVYATPDYQWRISTTHGGKWKLEKFVCDIYMPGVGTFKKYQPVIRPLLNNPLAMALWFNLLKRLERLGAMKL